MNVDKGAECCLVLTLTVCCTTDSKKYWCICVK